jgi:hypothetical protein
MLCLSWSHISQPVAAAKHCEHSFVSRSKGFFPLKLTHQRGVMGLQTNGFAPAMLRLRTRTSLTPHCSLIGDPFIKHSSTPPQPTRSTSHPLPQWSKPSKTHHLPLQSLVIDRPYHMNQKELQWHSMLLIERLSSPMGIPGRKFKEGRSWCGHLLDRTFSTTMMLQSSLWVLCCNIRYPSQK